MYFSFHFLVVVVLFARLITGAHLSNKQETKREGHANVSGEKKTKKKLKRATNRIIDQQHLFLFFLFILLGLFSCVQDDDDDVRFIGPIFVFVKISAVGAHRLIWTTADLLF